jgi:16S rRNA (adenine1518-N6/adenine1519-N6)-dimethyltransferase
MTRRGNSKAAVKPERSRRARKRFGQHFLEAAWVDKLVRVIDPQPDETFLEIGPGRGALTRPLAARAKAVIAFEIDRDLVRELRHDSPANVTIVEGDFLGIRDLGFGIRDGANPDSRIPNHDHPTNPESRIPNHVRVAGNLPYNVASPMLFHLLDLFRSGLPLVDATVMLQREVADRLLAEPGGKEYGVLSVLIRHGAHVERLLNVPAGAFRPAPNVLSSVVRLRFRPDEPPVRDRALFNDLVQAVFTRRRKTMANASRAFVGGRPQVALPPWLDPSRRPETLTVAEFARLADDFTPAML